MARSRGQQVYAEWLSEVKQAARDLKISSHYLFTTQASDLYFQQYLRELEERFEEDETLPNPFYWIERGASIIEDIKEKLFDKEITQEGIPIGQIDEDKFETTRLGVEYFGLRLLTPEEIFDAKAEGATSRASVFDSIASLLEYVSEIPVGAIVGAETIYNSEGEVIGFKVWVSNS